MRILRLLFALCCVALGVALGVLNRQAVLVDLAFLRLSTTLGVALLGMLLAGIVLGGLAAMARPRGARGRQPGSAVRPEN